MVLVGVEALVERRHVSRRHIEFLLAYVDVFVEEAEVGNAHFIGPEHGVNDEHTILRANRRQTFLLP